MFRLTVILMALLSSYTLWGQTLIVLDENGQEIECPILSEEIKEQSPEVLESISGEQLEVLGSELCKTWTLAKIKGWPESKVEMVTVCRRVFGQKVCWDEPRVRTRSCERQLVVKVCATNLTVSDWKKIEECIKKSVGTGVISGIVDPKAALPILVRYTKECAGDTLYAQIRIGLHTEKKCGKWK